MSASPASGPARATGHRRVPGPVLQRPVSPARRARLLPARRPSCAGSAPDLFNPLIAFKDQRSYFVAPEGDFENPQLPGWQLEDGATVSDGSSTKAVLGTDHAMSLTLPPGSSATSPEMCVDLNYPTFRFFVTQLEQDTDAELGVDVIYPALAKDNVRQARKFRLKAKDGWELTDDIKLEPQRLGKQAGWRKVAVRFRVKPGKKAATYKVDDLLIDPRISH